MGLAASWIFLGFGVEKEQTTRTNTGVLRFAQNDNVKTTMANNMSNYGKKHQQLSQEHEQLC
jgi:hypothetical protein